MIHEEMIIFRIIFSYGRLPKNLFAQPLSLLGAVKPPLRGKNKHDMPDLGTESGQV
jgi:hypothetical protein